MERLAASALRASFDLAAGEHKVFSSSAATMTGAARQRYKGLRPAPSNPLPLAPLTHLNSSILRSIMKEQRRGRGR